MLGVVASAIFTVVEFRWLSKDFIYVRALRIAYIVKAAIASILVVLGIAFAVALSTAGNVGGKLYDLAMHDLGLLMPVMISSRLGMDYCFWLHLLSLYILL